MKWIGIQYGLQMDPMEPMGEEHNYGVDGLGEHDAENDPHSVNIRSPARHVPRSEEWWIGLRHCILERGTDNDNERLSEEAISICNDTRWWKTYDTLRHFIRNYLSMPIPQHLGNNKTNVTNYLARKYEYNQQLTDDDSDGNDVSNTDSNGNSDGNDDSDANDTDSNDDSDGNDVNDNESSGESEGNSNSSSDEEMEWNDAEEEMEWTIRL